MEKIDERAVPEGERDHIEDKNKNASLIDCIPGTQRCSHNSQISEDDAKTHANTVENIAEKVEEVLNSESNMDSSESNLLETTNDPEVLVRDLESRFLHRLGKKKFSPQERHLLHLAASLHLLERRGITVSDLERTNKGKDNAEKIIQNARMAGVLIPLEKRIGKQKQYALSNYKYVFDIRANKNNKGETIPPNDISLILLKELSKQQYVYHHIVLETSLNYAEDYGVIKGAVLSERNKQKKGAFKLNSRRSFSFTVSPNGTVMIFVESTIEPFELHTYSGLIDFFTSCGQILTLFQQSANNRLNVVPKPGEWYLKEFDYNKDLIVEKLEAERPMVNWAAKGLIKLKHLGPLFQIYCKPMPDIGDCLRFDVHYATKQNRTVAQTVKDIVNGGETSPFVTAEDMLSKMRNTVDNSDNG